MGEEEFVRKEESKRKRYVAKKVPATEEEQLKEFESWSDEELRSMVLILNLAGDPKYDKTLELMRRVLKDRQMKRKESKVEPEQTI